MGKLYIHMNWVSTNLSVALQSIIKRSLYCFLVVVPVTGKTIYFRLVILTKLSIKQADI